MDQGAQGAQGLVGADIGRGSFSADVLFPGLQGEHNRSYRFVQSAADNATGHLADEMRRR